MFDTITTPLKSASKVELKNTASKRLLLEAKYQCPNGGYVVNVVNSPQRSATEEKLSLSEQ
jgi:hypothetical protein